MSSPVSSPVIGRVSSLHLFAGRTDILAVGVRADARSGQFNCNLCRVTLNGVRPESLAEVIAFVCGHRQVSAEVVDPQWEQYGTGYTPAGSIALTALE